MIKLILTYEEANRLALILDEYIDDQNNHIEDGQDKDEELRLLSQVWHAENILDRLNAAIAKL